MLKITRMITKNDADNDQDALLLQGIQAKNLSCLETFYKKYAQSVYTFSYRRTNDSAIASEAVSDTFVQLWQGNTSYSGKSSVKTWLLGIAKHKTLDILRSRGRAWNKEESTDHEQYESIQAQTLGAYDLLLAKQQREHLQVCMNQLQPAQSSCIHLHFIEGLTLAEIAEVLEIPANTAATRVHHARKKLKECMESAFGAGEVL
jgi:RNA polymerase sigma-70 factor, ECF subfamily